MNQNRWVRSVLKALGIMLLLVSAHADPPDPPLTIYSGGAFDGWDSHEAETATYLGGPLVTLSFGQNQILNARLARTSVVPLTLRESSDQDNRGIKAGNEKGYDENKNISNQPLYTRGDSAADSGQQFACDQHNRSCIASVGWNGESAV